MLQISCRPQTSCGSGLKQPSAAASPAWLVSIFPSACMRAVHGECHKGSALRRVSGLQQRRPVL